VLALVSVRGSIRYVVLPRSSRDALLADPSLFDAVAPATRDWWRLTSVTRAT
jgi:hypothetical protein